MSEDCVSWVNPERMSAKTGAICAGKRSRATEITIRWKRNEKLILIQLGKKRKSTNTNTIVTQNILFTCNALQRILRYEKILIPDEQSDLGQHLEHQQNMTRRENNGTNRKQRMEGLLDWQTGNHTYLGQSIALDSRMFVTTEQRFEQGKSAHLENERRWRVKTVNRRERERIGRERESWERDRNMGSERFFTYFQCTNVLLEKIGEQWEHFSNVLLSEINIQRRVENCLQRLKP